MNYKIAMVTGASSGIGKIIAQSLAKHNIRLVIVARRQDKLKQLQILHRKITSIYILL